LFGGKNAISLLHFEVEQFGGNQTLGIYGLRRDEESTKTTEIKAAVTGAIIALVMALFKLW